MFVNNVSNHFVYRKVSTELPLLLKKESFLEWSDCEYILCLRNKLDNLRQNFLHSSTQ